MFNTTLFVGFSVNLNFFMLFFFVKFLDI